MRGETMDEHFSKEAVECHQRELSALQVRCRNTVSFMGGAENDGHEIAGHENDGPNSRA